MQLFELYATLGLDTKEFDQNISTSTKNGQTMQNKMSGVFKAIKTAITVAGIAVAVKKISDSFTQAAAAADTVDKSSQKLGLSRKAYQEWGYVLSQNGGSIDTFGVAMKTLQTAMVQGTTQTDAALKLLGLSAEQLKTLSPEDALSATITAFQKLPEGAEKSAAAVDLFGKQGMELLPTLNSTAEATAALKQEANDLGLVLSDEAVDSGVEFTDAMDTMARTIDSVKTTLVTGLMPSVTRAADVIAPLLAKVFSSTDAGDMADGLSDLSTTLGDFVGRGLEAITGALPAITNAAMSFITAFIKGISSRASSIAKSFTELVSSLAGGLVEALPDLIDVGVELLGNIVEGLADAVPTVIPKLMDAVFKAISRLLASTPKLIAIGAQIAGSLVKGIFTGMAALADGVLSIFGVASQKISQKTIDLSFGMTDEEKASIAADVQAAINSGMDAANSVHEVILKINTQTDQLTGLQESVFADSKLTKKEKNSLTNAIKAYVDEGVSAGETYIDEKKAEYQAYLLTLVDDQGQPLYTEAEANSLAAAMTAKTQELVDQLDTAKTEYTTLLNTIYKSGGTGTEEEIAQLETLLTKISEIRLELGLATNEVNTLEESKVNRVKRGTATDEEFYSAVGYTQQMYTNQVADIQSGTDETRSALQSQIDQAQAAIDAATGIVNDTSKSAKEIADAQQVIADQTQAITDLNAQMDAAILAGASDTAAATETYNQQISDLYAGMAKGNPDAQAALDALAAFRDQLIGIKDAQTNLNNLDWSSDQAMAGLYDLYKAVMGSDLPQSQIDSIVTSSNPAVATKALFDALSNQVAYAADNYTPEQQQNIASIYAKLLGVDSSVSQGLELDSAALSSLDDFVGDLHDQLAIKITETEDTLTNNPMLVYLQNMLSSGSLATLDVSTLDGALENAFKTIDLAAKGEDVGKAIVDGVPAGIAERSGELSADDVTSLRDAVVNSTNEVFQIHSPSRVMFPVGAGIVAGVVQGAINAANSLSGSSFSKMSARLVNKLTSAIDSTLTTYRTLGAKIGKSLITGMTDEIINNTTAITNAITSAVHSAVASALSHLNHTSLGREYINESLSGSSLSSDDIARMIATALGKVTFTLDGKPVAMALSPYLDDISGKNLRLAGATMI